MVCICSAPARCIPKLSPRSREGVYILSYGKGRGPNSNEPATLRAVQGGMSQRERLQGERAWSAHRLHDKGEWGRAGAVCAYNTQTTFTNKACNHELNISRTQSQVCLPLHRMIFGSDTVHILGQILEPHTAGPDGCLGRLPINCCQGSVVPSQN